MARRRFNPRQPRDSHGRWKSTGGSSAGKSVARGKSRQKNVVPTTVEHGQRAIGNALGAVFAVSTGRPVVASIHAVGAATGVYRVGAAGASKYVQKSGKFSAAQKKTFKLRKAAIDKQVTRIEKAQNVALAGGYIFGLAATGAGLYNMNQASKSASGGVKVLKAIGSGGAGLKAAKASRGVYKITSMKR